MDSTSITRNREVALKDFSGGLNNYWDPSSIEDNEVSQLVNMDFTPTGALQSRPPIADSSFGVPVGGQYIDILGYFMTSAGIRYLVATTNSKTWVFNTVAPAWTEIWAYKATGYVQYAEEVVLSGKDSVGGTRWNPSTGSTAISLMPNLDGLAVFRDRMFGWGVQGTQYQTIMYYSNLITLADPTGVYTWDTANNFQNVGRGDGQAITMILADTDKIIIFKTASTYIFSYLSGGIATAPLDLFQTGIGAENKESVAAYRNGYIVLHDQTLYKMQNNGFTPLNSQKLVFSSKSSSPAYKKNFALSVWGDRALVWYSGNLYVLNLLTGTWSQWESAVNLAYIKQMPAISTEVLTNEIGYGITASGTSSYWKIYKIVNNPVGSTAESFTCKLRTKIYDFDTPVEWKRLYWWAADIAAAGTVTANSYVVALSGINTTWDTLDLTTWDVLDTRTWDRMSDSDAAVTTTRSISGSTSQRVLLKLDNALRFRRIYFEVYLNCDGTSATAPAQIFTLTPVIGIKAKATQGVS